MRIASLLTARAPAFAMTSLALGLSSPAWAGGGAHIVDDDATLPAGVCHVESWLTLAENSGGLAVAAPACTLAALPRLEIATAVQRTWGTDDVTTIAPALKLNLRSFEEATVGVAISGTAVWNPAEGRIETFALNVPVSHRINERLVIHANLGWIGQPGSDDSHALFWGAQAEFAIRPELVLMGEVFGTDSGRPGGQAGLRWVTDRGRIDVDLLAGHQTDGGRASSLTLGLTIRR
jgi:hypothetical protein